MNYEEAKKKVKETKSKMFSILENLGKYIDKLKDKNSLSSEDILTIMTLMTNIDKIQLERDEAIREFYKAALE